MVDLQNVAAYAFDLSYWVAIPGTDRTEERTERVYLVRHSPTFNFPETEFTVHRLSDNRQIGYGDSKKEARMDACLWLRAESFKGN